MKKKIAAFCLALALPFAAWALDLQTAKQEGVVGETPSGYLGIVVDDPNPAVRALVDDINRQRKEAYRGIAERNGTTLEVVEKLAAKKAIDKTPSGQYVKLPSGEWRRK